MKIPLNVDRVLLFTCIIVLFLPSSLIKIAVISSVAVVRFALILFTDTKASSLQVRILILIAYLLLVVYYRVTFELNLLANVIAYFILAFPAYFFIYTYKNTHLKVLKESYTLLEYIIFFQAFLVYISGFRYGFIPGDLHSGSTGHAHELGFFLFIVIMKRGYDLYFSRSWEMKKIMILAYLGIAALLTDTNQFLLALIVGFGVANFLSLRILMNPRIILLGFAVFGMFYYYLLSTNLIAFLTEENYLTNEEFSPKLGGYLSLGKLYADYPLYVITGTGIGSYSSRSAVALASPQLLGKDEKQVPFESNSKLLIDYLAKYYTPAKFLALHQAGVTGTFYTPFSTGLSLISEYGLIGLFIVGLLIFKIKSLLNPLKDKNPPLYRLLINLGMAYGIVFIYDNWLEHPEVIFPFAIILLLGLNVAGNEDEQKP